MPELAQDSPTSLSPADVANDTIYGGKPRKSARKTGRKMKKVKKGGKSKKSKSRSRSKSGSRRKGRKSRSM